MPHSSGVHSISNCFKKIGWNHALASNIKKTYASRLGRKPQHADAGLVKATYSHEWESYTKFCVVRNPFSPAVSDYNWRTRHLGEKPDFAMYLNALLAGDDLGGLAPVGFHNNWRQYKIGDQIAVDEVLRYENLNQNLADLLLELNVPFSGKLPKLKDVKPRGEGSGRYSEYYTPEAVELVAQLYREEIDAFGYKFEGIK